MDRAMKQLTHQFHKIFFHISKCLACNAEKTLQLEIIKKKEYSKLYEYMYKYIPILNVTRKTQNKNDSINSVLQHGRVVDNNCCVYFLLQDFHI